LSVWRRFMWMRLVVMVMTEERAAETRDQQAVIRS
jgi:hypothetical protein